MEMYLIILQFKKKIKLYIKKINFGEKFKLQDIPTELKI